MQKLLKEKEQIKLQANLKAKAKFISALVKIRKSKDYLQNKNYRQRIVKDLRKCLDYPNFKNIDLKTFFSFNRYSRFKYVSLTKEIFPAFKSASFSLTIL